ncbi:phytoene/squalene synthase family protein [Paenibacillus bovis]|nr:phytoene/squalene synthase family protein [Paenibacillus bovis]
MKYVSEADLQSCEEMIRHGSSSFYYAFSWLTSPQKEAVHVIYAFCRMIDDSVDEPEQSVYTIQELQSLFANLEQAEGHFIWPSLRWLFEAFPSLSRAPFQRQMDGQTYDLTFTRYSTMRELEHYCYLVAGTVGEMLLPVLKGEHSEEIRHSGIALGKAMQIVNIMRDIGEDGRRGRRYIPLELLKKHGYTEQELENGVIDERFRALMDELRLLAEQWFATGLGDLRAYPERSAFTVELAATFYAGIMDVIAENGHDVFSRRAYVDDARKRELLIQVAMRHGVDLDMLEQPAVS